MKVKEKPLKKEVKRKTNEKIKRKRVRKKKENKTKRYIEKNLSTRKR